MATQEEFRFTDAGSIFRVTCKKGNVALDISTATSKKIIFQKKDDSTLIVDGEYPSSGSGLDGIIQHTFLPGQLSVEGEWKAQVFIKFSDTEYYFSTIVAFKVGKNLTTLATVDPPEEPIP